MVDAVSELLNGLMPLCVYVFAGTVVGELIILGYAKWFATPAEKAEARRVSRAALEHVAQRIPPVPVIGTSAYESAAVTGPYAIMPVGTVLSFMAVWYICIPGIWVCVTLATAPPETQRLFELMMRAAVP